MAALASGRQFAQIVYECGGGDEVFVLAAAALQGKTPIRFADLNNHKVAEQLSKWLHRKCLDKYARKPR